MFYFNESLCAGTMKACTIMQNTWTYLTQQTWQQRSNWSLSLTLQRYLCHLLKFRCSFALTVVKQISRGRVELIVIKLFLCLCSCIFQSLTEVATMVARALYLQAGGTESQLSSITADQQTVRHIHAHLQYCEAVFYIYIYMVEIPKWCLWVDLSV